VALWPCVSFAADRSQTTYRRPLPRIRNSVRCPYLHVSVSVCVARKFDKISFATLPATQRCPNRSSAQLLQLRIIPRTKNGAEINAKSASRLDPTFVCVKSGYKLRTNFSIILGKFFQFFFSCFPNSAAIKTRVESSPSPIPLEWWTIHIHSKPPSWLMSHHRSWIQATPDWDCGQPLQAYT